LFTIGWLGGFEWGHRESLWELFFPAIQHIEFNCKLILLGVDSEADRKMISDYFSDQPNVCIEVPQSINWNDEIEIQNRILSFDIAIATLSDNPIQLSKSGIKAKQYMNNGIPVLANNLAENNSVVIDGYNGFFCDSAGDFTEKIQFFYDMPDSVYQEFSQNARLSISRFNHLHYLKCFTNIFSA
jgi:glycosyltransferase involved in cell wall biosynthesis